MAENRTVKVTLKAEIATYVASMMRGAKATDDLGAAATRAGSDIERAMEQSEKAAKSSGTAIERWGSIAKKTAAGAVLAFGALGGALLVQGVNANSFAEQNLAALETMLGSASAAKAAMDDVYGLATETPFQFPVLTDQYKTFVAARTEMTQIIPLMHSYAAAVAALGGGNDKLEQVADAFAKIQSYGRADAGELNSLALAGIPVWQMLADAAGESVSEIRDQVSRNMWDAQTTIAVLTTAMEEQFGGMLENLGDSFTRWQDKLKGAQRRTAEQLAVPLMEVGKAIMQSLTAMFNEATALLKDVDWAPTIEPLMAIPAAIDELTSRMSQGGLQDIINGVGKGFELMAAAGQLVMNVALPLLDIIGQLVGAGMPLVSMVTMLLNGFNALPAPVQAAIAALAMIRTLNGPYAKIIESITGTVVATRAAIAEQIRASQAMMVGIGAVNASAAAHGRLSVAMIGARAAMTHVATAARSAGSAIMGAFGGPVGLAVAGVLAIATMATTAWTDAQREAEEAAMAQSQAIDAVTNSLDHNTGAFTANTVKVITDQLIDSGFVPVLEAAGVGMEDFTAAVFGGAEAQAEFKSKLDSALQDPALQKYLADNKMSIEEFAAYLATNPMAPNTLGIDAAAVNAVRVWQELQNQLGVNEAALSRVKIQADAAAGAAGFVATPHVDTSQAESALKNLQSTATRALASFINITPQKKKSGGGGGGGGKQGEDPEVKRLKAEQKVIKKRADAEKKAAQEYEKLMRERSQAAQEAARAAEEAARIAADAEESALDKTTRAVDAYTSAQRQREAIQRTLDAETDPVRRAQLTTALGDALSYEADMLDKKNEAEKESEQAITNNQAAKELSKTTTEEAVVAETDYKKASEESAAVQERTAAQIEAAADRLATATENAAERSSSAMGGASEDITESLREWMDRLWEQIAAQTEWADNMVWLASNASTGVVGMFAEMGQSGASILAELRENGGAELGELEQLAAASATGTKDELITGLLLVEQLYPEIVARFGKKAADELTSSVMDGRVSVEDILTTMNAQYDGQRWTINIDADTQTAMTRAESLVSYIQGLRPTMTVSTVMVGGVEKAIGRPIPGRASGGEINGPGPKGRDSVLIKAAPGEHMLTAADVDAMGGQSAVYAFRKQLHRNAYTPDVSAAVSGAGMTRSTGTVIYQTVYYPIAEPSSKAAIRAARNEVG